MLVFSRALAFVFHKIDNSLSVGDLAISQQENSVFLAFTQRSAGKLILQWLINFSSTKIGSHIADFILGPLNVLIGEIKQPGVCLIILQILIAASETDDLELTAHWQTLNEELHSFFGDIHLGSTH